jgi:5-methyltetrahydropteroyltriglutamate--homocysteine methyltransferase
MKRSTDRIITTHVGSLARPEGLLDLMRERENDRPYSKPALDKAIKDAVAERVQMQVKAGIDVVTDGEMSKVSFLGYVKDRLAGFEVDPSPSRLAPSWQAEYDMFPEYYEGYLNKYSKTVSPLRRIIAKGPISYAGHDLLQTDIANLKAAVKGKTKITEVFMPSAGPSGFGRNAYYKTQEEFLFAVADAMAVEYKAIVDAGFILQVDDPWLIDTLCDPATPMKQRKAQVNLHVEAVNHSLRGIPEEKIRHHTCYGLNHGPRLTDVALRDVVPYTLKINAGAYSFEVCNPRHQHEWNIWADIKLPDGKILMPGLLGHANNYVEHPELIAEYIVRYAKLVGKKNVVAGADCGFSSRASYAPEVHPTIVPEKFKALAQGAKLATAMLWKPKTTQSATAKAALAKPAAKPAAKKAVAKKAVAKKVAKKAAKR